MTIKGELKRSQTFRYNPTSCHKCAAYILTNTLKFLIWFVFFT